MNFHGQPSMNGKVKAPSSGSGAFAVSAQRTVFPEIHLNQSVRTYLYNLNRHFLAGISLWRCLLGALLVLAVVWPLGSFPGRWWVAAVLLLSCFSCLGLLSYWRRRDYVYFSPLPLPSVAMTPLDVSDKIALFVTGHLAVENKEQRFTWLAGFYRTFATREHALMCYVKQHAWLGISHWPDEEIGLWYLFFYPNELVQLAWGTLTFGRDGHLAIALTYRRTIPKRGRFQPERVVNEIVYLAVQTEDDGKRILADLLYDQTLNPESANAPHATRNNR